MIPALPHSHSRTNFGRGRRPVPAGTGPGSDDRRAASMIRAALPKVKAGV